MKKKQRDLKKEHVLFSGKDIGLCVLLMVLSAIITFINLGDTRFPTSAFHAEKEQPIIIGFGRMVSLQGSVYLNAENSNQRFLVLFWNDDDGTWEPCHEETTHEEFHWSSFVLNVTTQRLMIVPTTSDLSILEMSFFGNGTFITPTDYSYGEAAALFDEQDIVPESLSFSNNMFFDENLHALTAYEFIEGMSPTERTHPPLGKSIIALGIELFGMSPFDWRFMCALFGILLIAPLYALAKLMCGSRHIAFLASFVFTFDFMRFVQSRVASLDIFLVTFIVFMYLFMYGYIQTSPGNPLSRKALLYLACSGVFMGLAIAVKWTGAFAALGLGVLFALTWRENRTYYAEQIPKRNSDLRSYKKDLIHTVGWCILFFGAIPLIIYCLSYIPFADASNEGWLKSIFRNQVEIFSHHAFLTETHEAQSRWWTWPFDVRPMFYFSAEKTGGTVGGIYTFGNPLLWWSGFLALVWCVIRWIKEKDKKARFLCIAWATQILPWAFITRSSFIYHYFPCVPFLALMVAYFIKTLPAQRQVRYTIAFAVLILALFVAFYPVLAGTSFSSQGYIQGLQWLPDWQFVK